MIERSHLMIALWPPLVTAFILSIGLVFVVRPAAHMAGAVARPKADRWHRGTIPLLGGVAIAGAFLLAVLTSPPASWGARALVAGAMALAVVGLFDDLRPLRPYVKFLLQLVVAGAVVASGVRLPLTGVSAADDLLTLLWLVGLTNAVNLLDNMDGLAAGIGLIAAAFRCYFFLVEGNAEGAALAAALCGALAGFLIFNFQPASIFMGDTGSLFIGMMVGGLNVLGPSPFNRSTVAVMMLPVLVLLVPIFDTLFVSVARTIAGRSIAQGGRDHTSHRLVSLGMSERAAVLSLWGMAVASGIVATLSYHYGLPYTVTLVGLLAAGLLVLGAKLGLQRVYPQKNDTAVVRLLADFQYKKQIATIGIDLGLVVLAYYSAYVLRFEDTLALELPLFSKSLVVVLLAQLAALGAMGTYQDSWRHAGVRDLVRLSMAVGLGVVGAVLILVAAFRFEGFSRAVFGIHWLLATLMLCGSRVVFRALGELLHAGTAQGPRTIIYGAGSGGVMVLRQARLSGALDWKVVGFIDDDPHKYRTSVQGVPVLGSLEQVAPLLTSGQVVQVIVATDALPAERLDALLQLCADTGVQTLRASMQFQAAESSRRTSGD